jgi:hypothetical protein
MTDDRTQRAVIIKPEPGTDAEPVTVYIKQEPGAAAAPTSYFRRQVPWYFGNKKRHDSIVQLSPARSGSTIQYKR